MKKAKRITGILFLLVIIAGVIVLFSSLVVIKENQYGVIKRFGKIERVIDSAGLSLKTPFVETVNYIPKNIQFYDLPESDVITKDKKAMVADSYVLWKITDPIKFNQSLTSSLSKVQVRIDNNVYNAMKIVISGMDQTDVISGRDGALDKDIIEKISDMTEYGITIISVETKRLDLPSDNKTAVFDRMISERDQMAATNTAEGEKEAQKTRNETDKEVAISISDAQAKAATIIAEGEAEYMRILAAAYSDQSRSDFYTFIRSLEAAKTSLQGSNKTLILSADSPIAKIFYNLQ
jgi:membrane protease subunit HflC